MWSNLYNYIDVCVKYIFLFENENNSVSEDFLIAGHPADLQMPGLWETQKYIEEIQSLPYIAENYLYVSRKLLGILVAFDRTHYYGHIAGIKKLIYQTHRDVIEKNTNIQFKVIKVPMSFALYHKIVNLSSAHKYFNNDEICTILQHYTQFDKPIMIQLVKVICEYLLNNKEILYEIQKYGEHPSSYQCTSQIMGHLISIFGTKETLTQFKRLVSSHITLFLTDEKYSTVKLCGQSLSDENYRFEIDQDGFALVFLFDEVRIECEWLMNNEDVLDTLFGNNMISSPYMVILYGDGKIFNDLKVIDIFKGISSIISTSKFLKGENVSQLILKFEISYDDVDISCITDIDALTIAQYIYFLPDFTKSLPEYVKMEADIDMHLFITKLDHIPKNLTRILCERIECDNDIIIPDHIEKLDIKKCVLAQNKTLTVGKNCKSIGIADMQGKFVIPEFIECEIGLYGMSGTLCFNFGMNGRNDERSLVLCRVTVYMTVNIKENMERIYFDDVIVTSESIVVFNDKCKNLHITNSKGRFDLRPYIGIVQIFNHKMKIEVVTRKQSTFNLARITFNNWCFTQTAKLSNIYDYVRLIHVSMAENTEIILNKACKVLLVHNCEVTINFQEVEYLESLDIWLSMDKKNNIRLVGLKQVNHLCFFGMCCDTNLIIAILASIENMQHVKFDHSCIVMNTQFFNRCYDGLMTFLTSNGRFENNPDLLSKFPAIQDEVPKVFVLEMLGIMVNYILRNVLDQEIMDTVSMLEFEHIAIDSDNCRLLRKLKRLKILRIRTKTITNEFLYNLPPNIELLDITGLFFDEINRTEKYVIKPSVIIQPYKRLKMLIIDVDFLYNIRSLSVLMPFLEVIEIQYSPLIKTNSLMQWKKIKVNELFIHSDNFGRDYRREFKLKDDEMLWFVEQLKFYIEFESLQCVASVLLDECTFLDPITLEVVK
ncbi:putative LRR containing protein [Trachipleistophora hominis]|uniref:Putative LRR containing protein n=1 Tax=Trachipleistophora hominis TaxID=72359 RepID=L7JSV2_TRAHO|nr:putative LRR containing protein [Trachipleistophora hominis]